MTYTLFTCVWGRRAILKLFCEHYDKWEINKVAVCSTDDDEEFMRHYGWEVIRAENNPLGAKWNAGLEACLDTDYIIQIGSDDLLSDNYFKAIGKLVSEGVHLAGIKTLYFWNSLNDECVEFEYATHLKNKFVGAGRLISTMMVEHILEEEGLVWTEKLNKGLDNDSEMRFNKHGYYCKEIKWPNPLVVDIKSDQNIWSYEAFAKTRNRHKHKLTPVSLNEVRRNIQITGHLERSL